MWFKLRIRSSYHGSRTEFIPFVSSSNSNCGPFEEGFHFQDLILHTTVCVPVEKKGAPTAGRGPPS